MNATATDKELTVLQYASEGKTRDEIALIGAGNVIAEGESVPAGAMLYSPEQK